VSLANAEETVTVDGKEIIIPESLIKQNLNYWTSKGYKITDISEGALGAVKIYTLNNKKEVRICKVFMKNNSTQCFKP
jgi:predicted phosphoadenosine phosphosulfate sulfurtransferase